MNGPTIDGPKYFQIGVRIFSKLNILKGFGSSEKNKNNENVEINSDGINVNNEKNTIYFLFATEPLTLILLFIEFLTSLNMITKKIISKTTSAINKLFIEKDQKLLFIILKKLNV